MIGVSVFSSLVFAARSSHRTCPVNVGWRSFEPNIERDLNVVPFQLLLAVIHVHSRIASFHCQDAIIDGQQPDTACLKELLKDWIVS